MIFIDANVIVHAFSRHRKAARCREMLANEFVTDTLCIAEAFHALSRILGDQETAARCVKSLFGRGEIAPVGRNVLFASVRKKSRLSIFDMIHYAVAKERGCTAIATYDKDFDGLDVKRIAP